VPAGGTDRPHGATAPPVHEGAGRAVAGFVSFTEVTDPGAHRAYNEWHQLDHLPEQRPLPGVLGGERWVATPACREATAVGDPGLSDVHYVTVYLMADPIEETVTGFRALAGTLARAGRFFDARRSHLSGPLRVAGAHAAPGALVSAAAVPFRPNRGVFVVAEPPGAAAVADAFAGFTPPSPDAPGAVVLATEGVAGVWVLRGEPDHGGAAWNSPEAAITVCYLDGPPLEVGASLAAAVRAVRDRADAPPLYAGPLEHIDPWRWDWFDAPGHPTGGDRTAPRGR
jgi:hypothetical protein